MTVLYILDYGTVGGATRSFVEMVTQMKSLGVHPIVVTSKRNELNDELESKGIRTVAAGHYTILELFPKKNWKLPLVLLRNILRYHVREFKAVRIIEREVDIRSIDLIHTNSARNSIGCRLNIKYGIPHIMHIREFADLDFNCVPLSPYVSLYNRGTDAFISISNAVKTHWGQKGLDIHKIQTIYNGIHYEDIVCSLDEDKRNDIIKMVIVGGVSKPKGQYVAIEALTKLPNEVRKNIYLDIIGWYDEEYVNSILNLAKDSGIRDNVNILGPKNNIHQILGNYQVGLMCSRAEGFGRTTAEYMHANLGVIASDTGANPELIEHEKCGLLFKSGDSAELCKCILQYYHNREFLVYCSNNAKKKAKSNYTDSLNADNVFNLYTTLRQI